MGDVVGIAAGSSGLFTASLVPSYAIPLQSGPMFRITDPHIKLKVDKDDPFIAVISVPEGIAASSFILNVSGRTKKGGPINSTFVIPIL